MKTIFKTLIAFTGCFLLTAKYYSAAAQCTPPGSISVAAPTSCTVPDGSITIGTPAPLANYQFSKDDGLTFQAGNVFNNLAPGTYYLRSREISTGCISTRVVQVLNNPAVAITSAVVSNGNCSGTPNGSITFTVPAAGYTYSIDGGTTFQAGAVFSNLAAGTYNLVAREISSGCTSAATALVTNAFTAPSTPATTDANPTSCTAPDGSITVNTPGPAANFTFSKDGGTTFQASNIFSGLGGGTYNIVARSNATGCVSAVRVVTLTNPAVITPGSAVVNNSNCSGTPNGSITITTNPAPTADFTFSINGGISFQASNVFTNLPAGSYQFLVKSNATGCTSVVQVATVLNSFAPISAPTVTSTDPTQCTVPDGSITVTAPASGVEYSINGGISFQVSNSFTGLAPGLYTVVVRSTTTGCISAQTSRTLQSNPVVTAPSLTSTNNTSCTVTSNGSITVTSPLGANFQYSLNGGAFQAGATFSGLTGGTYSVVAQNTSTGCISSATGVTLNNTPQTFSVSATTVNPTTCVPGNGQITLTVISPPPGATFTFSIDGGATFQASNVFTGLTPGSYSAVARANVTLCVSAPNLVTLTALPPGFNNFTLTNNTSCTAAGNGSINFSSPAPLADYSFSIDGGTTYQASPLFSNLLGGTYRTIARNNTTGCTTAILDATIFNTPAAVSSPAVSKTDITDCNTPNGSITITGPAGILTGHTFSIDNGITFLPGLIFNNLTAGVYSVVAKNTATGCVSSAVSTTIANPAIAAPTASATASTICSIPGNGSITVTAPASGVTYSIDGGATFQPGNVFPNLSAGTYPVVTRNIATGCISAISNVIVVSSPPAVSTPVLTISHPTSCDLPNGSITITSPVGPNFSYSINNGISFQASATFLSLPGGAYTIIAQNTTTGCVSLPAPATLNNPFVSAPSASPTSNTLCGSAGNGSISVLSPAPLANYSFSIDNGITFQPGPVFNSLLNGTYQVRARENASGCVSAASAVTVLLSPPFVPQPTATLVNNTNCLTPDGSITITAPSPVSGFTFSNDGGVSFQASNLFSNLSGGTYNLVARSIATGCISLAIAVTISDPATTTPSVTTSANTSCLLVKNGSITFIAPAPGTGYVYSIDGGANFQAGNIFSNLNGGNYPVMVRNLTTNCVSAVQNVTVASSIVLPSAPLYTLDQPSNCTISDGRITFTSPAPVSNFSFSIDGGVTYSLSPVFNNLAAGNYSLRAKNNATGCESTIVNVTVTGTTPSPAPVAAGTNPTTCSAADGMISFSIAPPSTLSSYTFSIDGGTTFQVSPVFTNLASGTYNTVFKLISTGCNFSGAVITLTGPAVAAPAVIITSNTNCRGTGSGSITVTSPLGASFEYSINNGTTWQSGTVFSSLPGGVYPVQARNTSTGCVSPVTTGSVLNSIVLPATPTATTSPSNSCISPTGQILFNSPAPISSYSFSIDAGVTFQASPAFTNLAPGTYIAVAKHNSTGCVSPNSAQITIAVSPAFPSITTTVNNPVSCITPDGSITFTQPIPFSSYQFSIDGGVTYQNSPVFTGLAAGIRTLKVRSLITGCEASPVPATVTLSSPVVTAPVFTVTPSSRCTPGNGIINVSAPAPLANYEFSIDNGVTFQSSPFFLNLLPGNYNVVARRITTGCVSAPSQATVNGPAPVGDPAIIVVHPTACAALDGSITVTSPVPFINYEFSIDDGITYQAGNIFNGLGAGVYNIKARALSTGCVSVRKAAILACTVSPQITKTAYKNGGNVPATDANINDVLNYVIEVQGSTPVSPPSITDVMSTNQQYIANSAVADNWVLNGGTAAWFGPTQTGTATALYGGALIPATDGGFIPAYGNNVFLAVNRITSTSTANVTFSGGSDGYRPIYWKTDNCQEKVMVKNHHSTSPLKCWNLTTNTNCDADLAGINADQNYSYTLSNGWSETINNKVYTIDLADGAHGLPLGFGQMNCIDLNPSGNPFFCAGYPKAIPGAMNKVLSDLTTVALLHAPINYDQANNRIYWAYDSTANHTVVYSLDLATGVITESNPILTNGLTIASALGKTVFLTTNRLLIEGGGGGNTGTTLCLDISAWPVINDCNPSNLPGFFTGYGFTGDRVSPLLNNAGVVTGFCTGANSCFDLNGIFVPMPSGYTPGFHGSTNYLVSGTKVITLDGYNGTVTPGQAFCFDFATNTSCGATNANLATPYAIEWRVPGKCFLTYGDGGVLTQWGIEASGLVQNSDECRGSACAEFSETIPDPAIRYCGPEPNNISFDELEIINIPSVHSGSVVTVRCSGSVVATYNIPANATEFVQDISGVVDYNVCPTPEITVSFKGLPLNTSQNVRTIVTYSNNGRFPEICYDAMVTTCDGNQISNQALISGGGVAVVQANISITPSCIPLPVTLRSFTASSRNCEVKLNWETAEELHFDRFELERSTDGGNSFSVIRTVTAAGSGSSYTYTDNRAVQGKNLYRLKMIDIDGKVKYSKVLLVSFSCDGNQTIILYPNPVKDRTTVSGLKTGDRIDVIGSNGQLVMTKLAMSEQEQIDLSPYANGLYAVIVSNKEGKLATIKVVKN